MHRTRLAADVENRSYKNNTSNIIPLKYFNQFTNIRMTPCLREGRERTANHIIEIVAPLWRRINPSAVALVASVQREATKHSDEIMQQKHQLLRAVSRSV
jgi:hypothetical protein